MPGRSLVVLANGGLSDYVTEAHCSKPTLIKSHFSALDTTLTQKVGHRVSRRLHPSVRTSSGEGYKLTTVTVCTSGNNSFPVGLGETAHHSASLTFAPQCRTVIHLVTKLSTLVCDLDLAASMSSEQKLCHTISFLIFQWCCFRPL